MTTALGDLIQATKAASGKTINDPCMNHLKESAKVMVTNVTSLLKTVKAVEDEHTRGTRALESTIEAIAQEIRVSLITYYKLYKPLIIAIKQHNEWRWILRCENLEIRPTEH